MPHVDEGTLHALLDGALGAGEPERVPVVEAHLDACADCRARLEAAAAARADAAGILGQALPVEAAEPDFAEVLVRAGRSEGGVDEGLDEAARRRRELRRQLGWTRGLAWAATVVLALGTGYLIRDLAGPLPADTPATVTAPKATGAEASAEAEVAESPPPPPSPEPSPAASGNPSAGTRRGGASDARSAGDQATQDEAAERERAGRATAARSAAPPEAVASQPDPALDRRVLTGQGADLVDEVVSPTPTVSSARAPTSAPASVEITAQDVALGAEAPWLVSTVAETREALDGPLYVLPRAALVEVLRRPGPAGTEVMSRQRLESGVPVRVLQYRRPPDMAAAVNPAGSGVAQAAAEGGVLVRGQPGGAAFSAPTGDDRMATAVKDAFTLVVIGPLPEELLEILAGSARPAP